VIVEKKKAGALVSEVRPSPTGAYKLAYGVFYKNAALSQPVSM
jgi:hypothetical protein